MSLAIRLLLAFGLLAVLSTASIGLLVRQAWRQSESDRFAAKVDGARQGIQMELAWEQSSARNILRPVCDHAAFVDQTLIDLQAGRLDSGRRLALARLVPEEMKALQLDELVLVTGTGEVLGSGHDASRIGTVDDALAAQLAREDAAFETLRAPSRDAKGGKAIPPALMARCVRRQAGVSVGLFGARYTSSILDRVGKAYGVRLAVSGTPEATPLPGEQAVEIVVDPRSNLRLVAAASTRGLDDALARLDSVVLFAGGITLLAAILTAIVLARSMARPIAQLAAEVREVASGEPRPVAVRGTREMRQLARAFNTTLHDLAVLRKRHAAMERIAAWREVARRVAHEIKNPLTPIRSSVETLRRLRARDDPQFDDYFEQATKGVLEDVHRIATIASDFARFARLPAPKPAPFDVVEAVRGVAASHADPAIRIDVVASPCPALRADRDQIVQVLTNLLQNAMDAVRGEPSPAPRIELLVEPCRGDLLRIAVTDNGPGIPDDLAARLFEPYVTTKAHGTGLGLSIVQRIVVEHGGEISFVRPPKRGASFVVLLPLVGPPPSSVPAELPEPRG
ncbi:MAG TPA: ATP-binding protein [Polyangiaceae bacterium]|nr:ATP-binding protein [Polyangiaceae bacterium]